MNHPAKYTDKLLPVFSEILQSYGATTVLDCFAGTGKIHRLDFETKGIEIEPEWANMHEETVVADSRAIPFSSGSFDAVCTSPTYGNRMADCHSAKDGSKRNTYTHKLGRTLHQANSGKMQWGANYRELHSLVWAECFRVVKPNGILILNMKNHIRGGKEVDVFGWHVVTLLGVGFTLREVRQIEVNGNGFGQNGHLRVPFEYVATLER